MAYKAQAKTKSRDGTEYSSQHTEKPTKARVPCFCGGTYNNSTQSCRYGYKQQPSQTEAIASAVKLRRQHHQSHSNGKTTKGQEKQLAQQASQQQRTIHQTHQDGQPTLGAVAPEHHIQCINICSDNLPPTYKQAWQSESQQQKRRHIASTKGGQRKGWMKTSST